MTGFSAIAIETSSATGSVALAVGDNCYERTIATPREQTSLVLRLVDELLAEAGIGLAGLDALVFGRGPGSFTGLRVAAAVTQGLSLASAVPIVAVSSLAALALRGLNERPPESDKANAAAAFCAVDARMGEVYAGAFLRTGASVVPLLPESIGPPGSFTPLDRDFVALGDAFDAYPAELARVLDAAIDADAGVVPRARELLVLAAADIEAGRFVPAEAALPVYLRDSTAWQKA